MTTNSISRLPAQAVLGAVVIVLGLIFLLDNLGFVDAHISLRFWPLLIILFGVLKVTQARTQGGYLAGGGLMLLGLVLSLDRLGLAYVSVRTWWPLILIGAGGAVVLTALRSRKQNLPGAVASDDSVVDATAVMGGFRRRISSKTFRGGEITVIMGGCELDLRDASIEGEAHLEIFAMWGGINLRVPEDWTVVLQGTPLMGGFNEKTVLPADAGKRLIVRGYAIMGGCEIRN